MQVTFPFSYLVVYNIGIFPLPPQNLNKQAYDLAKALLKRTAQAIEPYITNVSVLCPIGCQKD